ncbi:hypothetical protein V1278_002587 [Bradyrhizobium sp. AZCC 1577]
MVLIWVYYTSQIILMGAEITQAYAKHEGSIKRRRSQNDCANVQPLSQPGGAQEGERIGLSRKSAATSRSSQASSETSNPSPQGIPVLIGVSISA